jgi:aspartate/methionine/tyrosine aminotransferase
MNPRIAEVPPSIIRSINARKRAGDIDLGLGEPTVAPPLEPFIAALDWTRENGSPYSPNAGFPELRGQIARYLSAEAEGEWAADAENVCVTVGSEEALYLAVKSVIDPARDEVLIVEPCYLAYPKICILEGIRHRTVALDPDDDFAPSAARVLDAMHADTRLVVINSPANPTGRVWPASEVQALTRGLEARRGPPAYLLVDDVYRELHFGPDRPPLAARWYPHTLVAGSVSKSNAMTGLRLGWLAGPADVVEAATKVHQFLNTAATTFSQRVTISLFDTVGALGAHRPLYARSREALLRAAGRNGVELIPPEGTFYAFLRLPASRARDSRAAAEALLEEKRVVAVPGSAFGRSGEGWLRISWVAPEERLVEGLARIGEWAKAAG